MTPAREAEARTLLAEATRGPWRQSWSGYSVKSQEAHPEFIVCQVAGGARATDGQLEAFARNAALIAAAPTLLTEALDALAQQREELARVKALIATWRYQADDYPETTDTGRYAAAAVRLCADELESAMNQTGATR